MHTQRTAKSLVAPPSPASPAWMPLALTAAEVAFLALLGPAERLLHAWALPFLRSLDLRWPVGIYAALLGLSAAAGYAAWMFLVVRGLRRLGSRGSAAPAPPVDNPAAAHLADALLAGIAILLPYALVPHAGWLGVTALLGLLVCLFDLQDARRLARLGPLADDLRMDARTARPLRELAERAGLRQLELILAPHEDDQPAMAQVIPTPGRPTFVFTGRLVRTLSPPQLLGVFAHELAHWKLRHSRKTLLAHVGLRLLALLAAGTALELARPSLGMGELALRMAPPALLLWAVALTGFSGAFRAVLRRQERQAHAEAVRLTGQPEAYLAALESIARVNDCREPSWLTRRLLSDTVGLAEARCAVAQAAQTVAQTPTKPPPAA